MPVTIALITWDLPCTAFAYDAEQYLLLLGRIKRVLKKILYGLQEDTHIFKHTCTSRLVIVAHSSQPPGGNEVCVCVCAQSNDCTQSKRETRRLWG